MGGFLSLVSMPQKIRELKAQLRKAGFSFRPGKGSHTVWEHPAMTATLTLAGNDGDDAKPYQEKQVRNFLRMARLKEVRDE
jgi:predicted RNA binding protein YcfA (HicA-like mRNA interferase family)